MTINKNIISSFLLAFAYGIAYYILQYILYKTGIVSLFPTAVTLLNWDAHWYHSIVENGYQYSLEGYSNSGFFILFPLIWKALGLNPWTVSLLNITLFSAGFAAFNSIYKIDLYNKLLWLTFPSFYIAFVPYSESLFVFLSSMVLWGIVNKKKSIVFGCLFLLSLTRPVTVVLTPAFFIAELLTNDNKDWIKSIKRFFIYYGLPLLIGLALFIWYQHHATGIWLAYFKQQKMHWAHSFALPTLPFNSAFGQRLLWLNGIALFMGFLALLILIGYGIKWLIKNKVQTDKLFVLSCLYFTGMGFVTILFNPTWGVNSTNIFDIHRYTFVSPFFWILLHRFTIVNSYKAADYLKAVLLINLFWLTFAHYQDIWHFVYFNLATLFILAYMFRVDNGIKWVRFSILIIVNLVFQVMMLQWYIAWIYPG